MGSRVFGKNIDVSYRATYEFFENRAKKHNDKHPYVTTMYQDKNPELAVQRDAYEKNLVKNLLELDGNSKVLDIGCGIGRWAEEIDDGSYLGVDYSESLIAIARKNPAFQNKKIQFAVLPAQDVNSQTLKEKFNRFIISGILIYLNDEDVARCLKGVTKVAEQQSIIYIREPISVVERLTLDKFYSEDLDAEYSVIYRTLDYYQTVIEEIMAPAGFETIKADFLYPEHLNNRKETAQYYFILKRQ